MAPDALRFAFIFVFIVHPHPIRIIMFETGRNELRITPQLPIQLRAKPVAYQRQQQRAQGKQDDE
jgi:hypothetical protein